jgi:hypothetical protein
MDYRFLAFDLETAKAQPPHRSDWMKQRPLGICCAATYCDGAKAPRLWYGSKRRKSPAQQMSVSECQALVHFLSRKVQSGFTIVTWNGVGFDFDILAEESGLYDHCKTLALGHVDMLFHVICQLGFGFSLNAAAMGMRLTRSSKKREGALIPQLWSDGEYLDVFRHVTVDVKTTLVLAQKCGELGYIRWITRWGTGRIMQLPNGWQSASTAREGAKPILSFGNGQWARERITAWMRVGK